MLFEELIFLLALSQECRIYFIILKLHVVCCHPETLNQLGLISLLYINMLSSTHAGNISKNIIIHSSFMMLSRSISCLL